jgi:hypothetical protein
MNADGQETAGFTISEILVTSNLLALLVFLLMQLVNQTALIATLHNKRMDADAQARGLFERMAVDIAQMVRRSDVSYYVKTRDTPMVGNDLIGFYSAVQGFFPTRPSPVSVVAYRINSDSLNLVAYNRLERMGKGLDWNGTSQLNSPMVFLPLTLHETWPCVASNSVYDETDPARRTYEIIGPDVFRFEYYFVPKTTGRPVPFPATWTSLSTATIRDVAAIIVAIAVIDPKSRVLLTDSQIATLIDRLSDFTVGGGPGDLIAQWRSALDGITAMPRSAISGIRVYERCFDLSSQ